MTSVKGVLSSMLVFIFTLYAGFVAAHEVRPSVADMDLKADSLTLDIRLNLEAFLAEVDLSAVEDTNEADSADLYDQLRATPPADMQTQFEAFWPEFRDGITIMAGDTRIVPTLTGIEIPEVGDIETLRESVVSMAADLPTNDAPLVVSWKPEYGALVLRQDSNGEEGYTGYLTNGAKSEMIPRDGIVVQSKLSAFINYVKIGFEHIIPMGLDHILFVLGLFFLSLRFHALLWQVTAFTVAHTVTLAMGILGWVSIPPSIVEPLIALSIVYVAVENIFATKMHWYRPLIVFGFGLLHGLGFAFMLDDIGLSAGNFVLGLIGFNIGVELGQLTVIALAFLAVGLWFRNKPWYRSRIAIPASVAIALVGIYWVIERVFL